MRASLPPAIIDPAHRIQPVSTILEILLLVGRAFDTASGQRDRALAETRAALGGWVALGLGFAIGQDGEQLFDPVEVLCFLKRLGFEGRDSFWEKHFVHTARQLVSSLANRVEKDGLPDLASDKPKRFSLRLERRFDLTQSPREGRLRLKMPLPLVGPYLADLTVDPDEVPSPARLTLLPGRLELVFPVPPESTSLMLGADVSFTALPRRAPPDNESPSDLYLRPVEGLILINDRVRDVALTLATPGDARSTIAAFWDWLIEDFACGPVHYDAIDLDAPLDWVLDHGWYDCQLGAALLSALCRAVGIPARIVGGHFLYPLMPASHYWAEIWLAEQGWLPFDLLGWDLSRGGRDLEWRDIFAGNRELRLVTQCFPLDFVGTMSTRLPARYQMLQTATTDHVDIAFHAVPNNAAVYVDMIRIMSNACLLKRP